MIKDCILVFMFLVVIGFSTCFASGYTLVQDSYVVQAGENLETITVSYMEKNTYGLREFKEFQSGIIEINPWLLEREIQAGDVLNINYWVTAEAD